MLRDRDRAVDPCCDNVVGTGFRWPSATIFILCFVYFDHNGGSASTRCPRWQRSSTRTVSLHGFTKCDCVNKFFVKQNVLLLFHEAWNAYFIFRELWKDRFIFRETWNRPPLYHPLLWPTLIQKFMNFWSFLTRSGDKHDEEIRNCTSTCQADPTSQCCCESHDFVTFVTAPLQDRQSHRNVSYCCWIVILLM